jgi:hypothetical protein
LEGQISPEDLFSTVPGVGEALSKRIHVALDIDSLEELELSAHDGRLEQVEGIENKYTVVTEYHGPNTGRRVIRGYEKECSP